MTAALKTLRFNFLMGDKVQGHYKSQAAALPPSLVITFVFNLKKRPIDKCDYKYINIRGRSNTGFKEEVLNW